MEILTDRNFTLFAAKYYENPLLDTEEFYEDIKRFSYLKRLFNQYENGKELKENLILNHIIVIYNVFGTKATEMLFMRLEGHESVLKTFLIYLQRMPSRVENIGPSCRMINNKNVPLDPFIWNKLSAL
jgi:hypothetical protein